MIDAIYVISLERLPERRKKITDLLSEVDFCPVYLFDAVDGQKLSASSMSKEGFYCYDGWEIASDNNWWNRPVKLGEAGCMLSHYLVWKDILKKGFETALILEGDATFVYEDLVKGLQIVNNFVGHYDIFYLGCNPIESGLKVNSLFAKCDYTYNTHGYIVTKECAGLLASSGIEKNLITPDEFLSVSFCDHPREDLRDLYSFKRKLNAYRLLSDVVTQTNSGGSQTEKSEFVN